MAFCASVSTIAGWFLGSDIQALVLVYLYGGCIVGLAMSQLYHRVAAASGEKKQQQQQTKQRSALGEKM